MTEFEILPKLIGVSGRKHNGKDTVGNYLVEVYDYKRIAFADKLKEACMIIFGLTKEQVFDETLKDVVDNYWGVSPRIILQYVGTDLLRNQLKTIIPHIDNNIWVKAVHKQILDELKKDPLQKFVITDVRFENEIQFIKEMGGVNIRITRPTIENNDTHSSENQLQKCKVDYDIINDNTLESLYMTVDETLHDIFRSKFIPVKMIT
jgi:hypothetical protein